MGKVPPTGKISGNIWVNILLNHHLSPKIIFAPLKKSLEKQRVNLRNSKKENIRKRYYIRSFNFC